MARGLHVWLLDKSGEPVLMKGALCDPANAAAFAAMMREGEDGPRRVGLTPIRSGTIRVSTVFLGIDHACGDGPPVLWETAVFTGAFCEVVERCSGGREQAEAMHAKWVRLYTRPWKRSNLRRAPSGVGDVSKPID